MRQRQERGITYVRFQTGHGRDFQANLICYHSHCISPLIMFLSKQCGSSGPALTVLLIAYRQTKRTAFATIQTLFVACGVVTVLRL
jgi:hypothetical protein